jgi:tight adherence protein C
MTPQMIGLLAAGLTLMVVLALVMSRALTRQEKTAARLLAVQRSAGVDQVTVPRGSSTLLLQAVGWIGTQLMRGGALSEKTVAGLEQTLQSAGFRGDRALAVFVGGKVLLLVLAPLLVWLLLGLTDVRPNNRNIMTAAAAVMGLLAPDFVAQQLRKRYLAELERGLPDALDLMVICAEAGLGLETAIDRVAAEIGQAHRSVANEFALTASELRILADRRQALDNMGSRTGVENLKQLATTLGQTLQYGTPLTQALRTLAGEMRREQLVKFEARAARLPVLLTLPMIIFILPTVFLVVAGPAMLQALRIR